MARILSPGSVIGDFTVVRKLGVGAMAIAYEATASDGRRIFLKQYKSPSPTVSWFSAYTKQQAELKRRIELSPAKAFCYELVAFFEEVAGGRCYFQAFEFVDGSSNLRHILEMMAADGRAVPWERRLILARVLVTGLAALHEAKIVHCDLKPENVQLVEDPTIRAGFRLKLIDMDFAILADRKAAWHGEQGYVGSPGYWSPEHLLAPPPSPASDVFSCGLMLYELLGGGHPFPTDGDEEAFKSALRRGAPPPRLDGVLGDERRTKALAAVIHRCVALDALHRPAAAEVQKALLPSPAAEPAPPPKPRPPAPVTAPSGRDDAGAPRRGLRLAGESGALLDLAVSTVVGRDLLVRFGPDARYASPVQMRLEPDPSGSWFVVPDDHAVNETLLNGKAVRVRTRLSTGDLLSVGREANGVSKLPVRVVVQRGGGDAVEVP